MAFPDAWSALLNFAQFQPIIPLPASAGRRIGMSLLAWNDSYSVGVKTIDQQHSGLFGIVNELHTAMMKGQAQGVVGPLLDKLVKYTEQHFAYEERMMAAAKYPGLMTHRAHHADLTRQVEDFMVRYKRGDGTLNIQLLRFLSDWLTRHIKQEDKEYGPWLNRHGAR
jgi:hemerythrin-like metal-binding protein